MDRKKKAPASSFKLDVSVRFFEKVRGKRLYKVHNLKNSNTIFVGTKEECGRYLTILQEKIDRQLNRKRLPRSLGKRVYRADFSDLRTGA